MLRLALLISGSGTTMEQILLSCRNGTLKGLIEPTLVIASKDSVAGIKKARNAGMPYDRIIVCQRDSLSAEQFEELLLTSLEHYKIDLVGQFGWLPMTPVGVIRKYKGRIFNQHSAPLDPGYPDFGGKGMYGRRAHCARLLFSRSTGCPEDQFTEATTHFVTEEIDRGAVIGRIRVPILPNDDVISLQERVLPKEHKLQIQILEQFARRTIRVKPRKSRLIKFAQVVLLREIKEIAGLLFPKG